MVIASYVGNNNGSAYEAQLSLNSTDLYTISFWPEGASQPSFTYRFKEYHRAHLADMSDLMSVDELVYQWLLFVASDLPTREMAYRLVVLADEMWYWAYENGFRVFHPCKTNSAK